MQSAADELEKGCRGFRLRLHQKLAGPIGFWKPASAALIQLVSIEFPFGLVLCINESRTGPWFRLRLHTLPVGSRQMCDFIYRNLCTDLVCLWHSLVWSATILALPKSYFILPSSLSDSTSLHEAEPFFGSLDKFCKEIALPVKWLLVRENIYLFPNWSGQNLLTKNTSIICKYWVSGPYFDTWSNITTLGIYSFKHTLL